MSIENNLKRIVSFGQQRACVPDTDEIFNDEIVICTDDTPDISNVEMAVFPRKLILSCDISGELVDTVPKVFDITSGQAETPKSENIYSAQFPAYKSVHLKYAGFGKLLFDDGSVVDFYDTHVGKYRLDMENTLLQQSFAYQKCDIKHANCQSELQLYAYGGRFNPKDDISQIQQTFFQIKHVQGAVGIAISDEAFWNNKGIDPFSGGIFHGRSDVRIIAPPECIKHPSIGEQINSGAIKIPISTEAEENLLFRSCGYSQNLNKIEIIFAISTI